MLEEVLEVAVDDPEGLTERGGGRELIGRE